MSHDVIYFDLVVRDEAAKYPSSMMLPPPCLTAGTVFFRLNVSPKLKQHMIYVKISIYVLFEALANN
jgi:hypothetical protein